MGGQGGQGGLGVGRRESGHESQKKIEKAGMRAEATTSTIRTAATKIHHLRGLDEAPRCRNPKEMTIHWKKTRQARCRWTCLQGEGQNETPTEQVMRTRLSRTGPEGKKIVQ